jgi:coenzyme F420-0:L-glutamate ligase/coenzyme F420-1:gamma-L-glutamate ligase
MYAVRVVSRSDSASFMSKRPKIESTLVSEADTRKKNEKRAAGEVRIIPIAVSAEIRRGDSLSAILLAEMQSSELGFQDGDILVVKHKVVSKAEGAVVALDDVRPSALSKAWARRHGLDARLSELALRESRRVVRRKRGVLITETKHGFVCANSGVDVSNVDGGRHAVLLPADPDRSAARIRSELKKQLQLDIAVIVSDSFGRPWREGLTEVAIGVAGMRPLVDYRGLRDPHGYSLHATIDAVADELACAAGLVCGKLAGTPACIIRGYAHSRERRRSRGALELIRPAKNDLFR